ncbi:hypothetical protein KAZ57_03365 [Patescibacteria group bacterium]|nr:hypothetical protein [Patescibacteria group bacterium]
MLETNIWEKVEALEKARIEAEIAAMWAVVEMLDGEVPPFAVSKKHPYFEVCPRCGKHRWKHLYEVPADIWAQRHKLMMEGSEWWLFDERDFVAYNTMLCCADHMRSPLRVIPGLDCFA